MLSLTTLLHSPALRPRWRALLWGLAAFTCAFAFAPNAPALDVNNGDKLQHILAFGTLAGCATLGSAADRRAMLMVLAVMLGFGILIEVVQSFIPSRSADWKDVVADMAGAGIGVLIIHISRRFVPTVRAARG